MKECCTNPAPSSEITFQTHPSERKKSRGVVACCGCSCCCCCLHSLGSLVGGIYGTLALTDEETFTDSKSVLLIYWGIILALSTLPFAAPDGVQLGLVVTLGGMPALQLFASMIAFVMVSILPKPEETYRKTTLWRITKCSFLGTVIGCLAMLGGGAVLSNIN
ncbi:MAG: hypothetical protein AABZ60_11895 [Planctomycetota bacterium]